MQNHFGDITNLFHSFEKIDGNMFGLCAYYLASPLNLLMLVGNIVDNIMLVALLKIGFCGLTSYLYFSYHTKGKTKQTFLLLLSTIYALSSYNMMYMLNIMWLDSAVLAPLVCLSIDYLQRKRKIAPYILTMAGTIFCNYYTGCMVGIFSALYFLWTFFQENTTKQEIWKAKKKILQFMLGAMLALGISTCILLPVLKDISDVRVSPGIQSFLTLKTECSLEQILARFWLLSFQGTDMSLGGAPNLLSTGLAFFLLLSYFTSSGEEKKKKVLTGIFLAILVLSVILQTTNLIWSGFNFPANGPYRYGFLLTLFFLTLAAKGASGIENEVQQKKKNALLTICTYFVLGSYLLVRNQISIASFLLSSAFFLGTIATLAYAKEKGLFVITDGKRNDIGTTMEAYAAAHLGEVSVEESVFAPFDGDALTVNGYLGSDGINPLLPICKEKDKGIFVLVKTSNPSSGELQDQMIADNTVYRTMGDMCEQWGEDTRGAHGYSAVGAVVGATYPAQLGELRQALPHTMFLVPGYGAQGGGAKDVAPAFDKRGLGAIINSSRAIMCAYKKGEWKEEDYAAAARAEAIRMRDEIAAALK